MVDTRLELKEHFRQQQRIAPDLKKIVFDPNIGPIQKPLPNVCDQHFQWNARSLSGPLNIDERSRKLSTGNLPRHADRQALQDFDMSRQLERGEAIADERNELRGA
jgi:hypothetical protein